VPHAELRETRRALEVLSEVSRAIAEATLDVASVLGTIVSSVASHLGEACALWGAAAADGSGLVLLAGAHRDPAGSALIQPMIGQRIDAAGGVTVEALRARRAVALADLPADAAVASYTDERARRYFRAYPPRHAAAAPLLARGQLLGALSVSRLAGGEPYSAIEVWLVEELANRAALALGNARTADELRRSRELLELVTDVVPALISYVGPDLRYRWCNAAYQRWFGLSAEDLVDRSLDEVLGPEVVAKDRPYLETALSGEPVTWEMLLPYRFGPPRFVRTHLAPHRSPAGAVEGLVTMVVDVTVEKQAAAHMALVADAGQVLARSLDWERTLHTVIDLAIPALGELGFFDVVEAGGEVRRIALAKGDPRRQAILDQTRWVRSERADLNLCALSSGQSGIHPAIDDAWLRDVAVAPAHYQVMADLGFSSMITVPLRYEDRLLGALTLFHTIESGRRHDDASLRLAEELAHRAAAAVENARLFREARQAIALRDEFLSIAGHELRTPLTALRLQVETVARGARRGDPLETIASRADKALRHLDRFGALVDDLLDTSRISAGRLRLERTRFALAEVIADVVGRVSDDLARAGCEVVTRLDPAVIGQWDRVRIEQIVDNLMSNAIKYGRGQPIEIAVDRVDDRARLSVRDHGIGVAPEDQARIFQRFERAVSPRHFGGLGLGLWIAHQLVAAHGGVIRVASAGGEGAEFQVELPLG
jgi:PAS domain S-box-containing protein